MTPEIRAVLNLQSLDGRASALQKEIEALPKHVAEIEKKLDAHKRKLDIDRAALAANQKERRLREDDIKAQDQKISKLKDQSLQAKSNEQYKLFQQEMDFCSSEIKKAEERILQLMTQAEPLEKNVKAAEALLAEQQALVTREQEHARKRSAEDKEFLDQALEERKKIVSTIDSKLLAQYERIRNRYKGVAIADGTAGRCGGCQMVLRPQHFQDLKKAERLYNCESCGRILYYNPPVNLQHEIHQKT